MATLTINILPEEKEKIVQAILRNKSKTISVANLAKDAKLNPNRSRFIVEELLEEKRIKRTVTKAFNERYIRYSYEVMK